MPFFTHVTLLILLFIAAILLAVMTVWRIWQRKKIGNTSLTDPIITEKPAESQIDSVTHLSEDAPKSSELPSHGLVKSPILSNYASLVVDLELKLFLEEIASRIKEEEPNLNAETTLSFVEELVDRIDDLKTILENQIPKNTNLVAFRQQLIEVISECGAELIHADQWDPSLQRAIAKDPTPNISSPVILRYGSTGIRRNDQLIRKQEVVLAIPAENESTPLNQSSI